MRQVRIPEVMDDSSIDPSEHAHALRSLNRVNYVLGVDRRLRKDLRVLAPQARRIVDLACGGGGFLAGLQACDDCKTLLIGVDRSESALAWAKSRQPRGLCWVAADAAMLPFADASIDIMTSSLFLHHLDEAEGVKVLREAARVAGRAVLCADLVRSRVAWLLTWIATRLVSRCWIFHVDGPRSVRAAYTPEELAQLVERAELQGAVVSKAFPFRMILLWKKAHADGAT